MPIQRIRTIKPEFFRHLELVRAERNSGLPLRVAYIGLWTIADRAGRFKWQPENLRLDILPHDDIDIRRVLDALISGGWVRRYVVNGQTYGVIPSFSRHQRFNSREPLSDLPSP